MFDLPRYVCELIFGSSLALSRESFEHLSANLHALIVQIVQQSLSIALRSRRTRLLADDLQAVLQCRSISPLFGYCCSSTTNSKPAFQSVHQGARTLFTQTDAITTKSSIEKKKYRWETLSKKCLVTNDEIVLHVEWLAIAGEQNLPPARSSHFEKSILSIEQELYLSFLQSKTFHEESLNVLRQDQTALSTILPQLIDWCRQEICECLVHSCRLGKRRQLAHYLTIIDCLLENSSTTVDRYLHVLSPMILTCLLYDFEVDEPLDVDVLNEESVGTTSHVWSLRLLAARAGVKILQRSQCLAYDDFYIRIVSRLVHSLTAAITPPSIIHAILHLFERLGCHASRTFLLPHLIDIHPSKISSSKAISTVLERIASMLVKQ